MTAPLTLPVAGQTVGNTPVLWTDDGYWAKLEGFNFGGIKDRAALYMVEQARRRGELRPGAPIVESTSGTLGLGLALAGVLHGHPVHVVTDPGLEPIVERMLVAHGARVHVVPEPSPHGGWQQARMDRVAELLAGLDGAWWPNQYGNPDNPAAYGGSPPNCPRSSTASTSWSARSAPGATPPGSPGPCAPPAARPWSSSASTP